MITITQGLVWARVGPAPPEADAVLAEAFAIRMLGAEHSKLVQEGRWDGRQKLYNRLARALPAGLADRAAALLRDQGFAAEVAGRLPMSGGRPHVAALLGVTLHAYQAEAADAAARAGRAFLQSPTGSGKTEIGAELVRRAGVPTLWLCHRQDLLAQTAERLEKRLGIPVGTIGAGAWDDKPDVVVGMVPTLARRVTEQSWWDRWRLLVLDECHHTAAGTWYDLAQRCRHAAWRFGLSATPLTADPLRDAKLEGATGPRIVVRTIAELVEGGFLARPTVVMLRPPAESYPTYEEVRAAVLPDWRDDPLRLKRLGAKLYAEAYRRGVSENEDRTYLFGATVARHARAGEKALVLFTDIMHGHGDRLFARAADCSGGDVPIWKLDGRDPLEDRQHVVKLFQTQRRGAVLVASGIFSEGVDIPEIDVMALAGGGKAELATLQKLGRGLRRRPDKFEVLIYDARDGRSADARKDYLAQHTAERLRVYREQGFAVEEAA